MERRYHDWVVSEDDRFLVYEPADDVLVEDVVLPPNGAAETVARRALLDADPGFKARCDRVLRAGTREERAALREEILVAIARGNEAVAPRVVRPNRGGAEIPLHGLRMPDDVLRTLMHCVLDKSLFDLADLGAAVCAMHEVVNLELVWRRGMELGTRENLANSALRWTLDALESWPGDDYRALGASLGEMYAQLGLSDSYAA